ncbi:MAG: hypothetical protein IJY39_01875 [Clostridia bacterium]|nr:hypothetical protein [Clostridia bacterium]
MFTYSEFEHRHDIDAYRINAPLSGDYRVYAKGGEIPVYTCRISKYSFNTWWPGHQRPFDQSVPCSYINLVGDEAVTLKIEAKKPHSRVMLKPYSKNVKATEENGVITVKLKENGQYVLELDNHMGLLYIFYSKPITCPDPASVTHYFGPGIYYPRQINLKSGDRVYIDKDALVYGCFLAHGADNVEIFGNGILDDSGEERFISRCYEDYTVGNMKFYDCKNLRIRGVGMVNSAIWCLNLFHCFDVSVEDIKIFGQWRYNTDGIDICNCQNISIKDSFVHSFDDTITIKGILRYQNTSNKNIHVEGCTLWCDWGKTCEIGIETGCPEYENISFINCDLIRPGNIACDIANGYTAYIHDIRFENLRVEYNSFDSPEQLQESDDMVYTRQGEVAIPNLIIIHNNEYRDSCGTNSSTFAGNAVSDKTAWVTDVVCKDITVYYDEGVPLTNGKPTIAITLCNNGRNGARFENITIENIVCNGKRLPKEDVIFYLSGQSEYSFK